MLSLRPYFQRTAILTLILFGLAFGLLSCGGSNNNTRTLPPVVHRALISNYTNSNVTVADTDRNVLSTLVGGVSGSPGLMALSSDRKFTLAFAPVNNSVLLISNAQQAAVGGAILGDPNALPNQTVSILLTVDDGTILAAIPNEVVIGQAPGAVDVVSIGTSLARQPSIPLVSVRYLAATPNGNRVVAMSDTANNPANPTGPSGRVWILTPSLIGSGVQPYTEVSSPAFDHPVFALGSADNNFAYVLNCGPECGGVQAGIVTIDLTSNTVMNTLAIPGGATTAFVNGNTVYVAGTTPGTLCAGGSPTYCGTLTSVDLGSFTVQASVEITDGYHDRIALGANNLLFVGSRGCSILALARGCLSLFDVTKPTTVAKVAVPAPFIQPAPDPGDDVTGIAPIRNKSEVYVIQGGELIIYDTTTAVRKVQDNPPDIVGQAIDVKALD